MNVKVTLVASGSADSVTVTAETHPPLRIFQVFVNVDQLRIRRRCFWGLLSLPTWKHYGFYAVMLIAAYEGSKPQLLLALAREALVDEFSPLSATSPKSWNAQMIEWRMVGAAPPLFQQPGCIDDDWGAAWYESADQKAKEHRYRLVKVRLWQGKRATRRPPAKQSAGRLSGEKDRPESGGKSV